MSNVRHIPGGVHPPSGKALTRDKALETIPVAAGELYAVPLAQHIGAPAKPLVKKGDEVVAGQKIGDPAGFISAAVHAPVSGKVEALAKVVHPVAGKVDGILIRASEEQGEIQSFEPGEKFADTVLAAGITGLGGATFPTHVKLSPPRAVDTLILNGSECEPFLTCDYRTMLEHTEEILDGAKIVMDELGIEKLIVGIEDDKPEAVEAFEKMKDRVPGMDVAMLKVHYPQGGEKQLIYATTGRIVPEGKLPLEVGVIVHNVGTVMAVSRAVRKNEPLIERSVTVTGSVNNPKNVTCRIGTPVSALIEAAGGIKGTARKVIMGGPMMGFALSDLSAPVMKGTSGVLVLNESDLPDMTHRNCIRCGRCVKACPMGLVPVVMEQFSMKKMYEKLADWHVLNCIECGCCSYACPSRRTLVGEFKTGKRHAAAVIKARGEGK